MKLSTSVRLVYVLQVGRVAYETDTRRVLLTNGSHWCTSFTLLRMGLWTP